MNPDSLIFYNGKQKEDTEAKYKATSKSEKVIRVRRKQQSITSI